MANVSNALTGYWEEEGVSAGWKIAWTVTQNSNFTWTINLKFYVNTHYTYVYKEITPYLRISGENSVAGTTQMYGGSTDYVFIMEHTFTRQCNSNGSLAIKIEGFYQDVGETSLNYGVWGHLTLPSFSGSYVKIDATTYKHAMAWIKINGTWKRARQYVKVNGQWKLADYKWLYNP